jgi:hypothetical protein
MRVALSMRLNVTMVIGALVFVFGAFITGTVLVEGGGVFGSILPGPILIVLGIVLIKIGSRPKGFSKRK